MQKRRLSAELHSNKNMERKTLKDIQTYMFGDDETVCKGDLKEEAVKWFHGSDDNKHKFIKEFFNLTDEEIKQGSQRY